MLWRPSAREYGGRNRSSLSWEERGGGAKFSLSEAIPQRRRAPRGTGEADPSPPQLQPQDNRTAVELGF